MSGDNVLISVVPVSVIRIDPLGRWVGLYSMLYFHIPRMHKNKLYYYY